MDEQLIPDRPGTWLYVRIVDGLPIAFRTRVEMWCVHGEGLVLRARFAEVVAGLNSFLVAEDWRPIDSDPDIRWAGPALNDAQLASRRLGLEVS